MSRPAAAARQALIPVPLILLSVVPLSAGALRLIELAGGPEVIPDDDRFAGVPAALVVHIVAATVFALLGAFQFVPGIRRRHLDWHRRAGRLLAVVAMLVVGSALWLTLFYPPQPGTGDVLFVFRLLVVAATGTSVILGIVSIHRRDIAAHRAWMIRAYALSLGAGTQVFTEGFGGAVFGTGVLAGDLAKGAGWAVNLAVAEWLIHRRAVASLGLRGVAQGEELGTRRWTHEKRPTEDSRGARTVVQWKGRRASWIVRPHVHVSASHLVHASDPLPAQFPSVDALGLRPTQDRRPPATF